MKTGYALVRILRRIKNSKLHIHFLTTFQHGEKMDPSEVEDIFKEADGNKDDRLDYEEV